jgi:hypothetical protein
MSDTTVTVVDPPDGDPPQTPDVVAETAVAAIGETSRAAATAETASATAQTGAFQSQDAADQAKIHADRAEQAAQQIGTWATAITDAVAKIPTEIAATLQTLVKTEPDQPATTTTDTAPPKAVTKPGGHWATRKVFGKGKNAT